MSEPVELALTGPTLLGSMGSYFLYGIFIVQLYDYVRESYFSGRKKENYGIRACVLMVFILNTMCIVSTSENAWYILVLHSSRVGPLTMMYPTFSGGVALCVQWFFAWRIWILRHNIIEGFISALVFLLALVQFGAGIGISVQFSKVNREITRFGTVTAIKTHLLSALICDSIITITLVIMFNRYRSRSSIHSTRSMLASLSRNTVESGLIITVFAILNLTFYYTTPNNMIHVAFQWLLGRVYANVLLASMVRSRSKQRANDRTSHSTTPMLPSTGHLDSKSSKPQASVNEATAVASVTTANHDAVGVEKAKTLTESTGSNGDLRIEVTSSVEERSI
ncbi:hypothetical protein FA15DRAFT_708206 [Coprinopsis marcescibilis]|uniref:DUF6534 domain-containing protein n=1 Tax=Coprinopsis marcescibilis TaxID=230819 RepID=A0A5C3KK91_COPMA|nr:hypothetical protein FA15DRAFT_708206 [Coprinopsis marcescibilis]